MWKCDKKITAGWRELFLLCLFVYMNDDSAVMKRKKRKKKINMNHFIKVEERRRVSFSFLTRTLMAERLPTSFEILWFIHYFCQILPETSTRLRCSIILLHSYKQKQRVISGFSLKNEPKTKCRAEFSADSSTFSVRCVSNGGSRPSESFGPNENFHSSNKNSHFELLDSNMCILCLDNLTLQFFFFFKKTKRYKPVFSNAYNIQQASPTQLWRFYKRRTKERIHLCQIDK